MAGGHDMMKSLVAGKTVTVTYFQRDRYGRILGQVYAPDGMNLISLWSGPGCLGI
ncbi:hypothetical protein ECP03048164_5001 [Escherichia coli P0304816.4]|nr:hypothetical protein ECP03048164_5001 [Escherichia coli P0304816.4]